MKWMNPLKLIVKQQRKCTLQNNQNDLILAYQVREMQEDNEASQPPDPPAEQPRRHLPDWLQPGEKPNSLVPIDPQVADVNSAEPKGRSLPEWITNPKPKDPVCCQACPH